MAKSSPLPDGQKRLTTTTYRKPDSSCFDPAKVVYSIVTASGNVVNLKTDSFTYTEADGVRRVVISSAAAGVSAPQVSIDETWLATAENVYAHGRAKMSQAVNGANYEYVYDNIGNREFSLENNTATMYEANELNQYTSISENGGAPFVPQFDADGNQTIIKTDTGIWSAIYNAENRPVTFTNSDSNTVVECQYDSMGRRAFKKVTINGSVTLHQRYIYRGYLQIACVDLTRSHHPVMWLVTWDPTQPVATRPLAIRINGSWYTYGWDLTKNICELYSTSGFISTSYSYTPFGSERAVGSITQPIQWGSEFMDDTLGMAYYIHRHFNHFDGRWISRDKVKESFNLNLYSFVRNSPILKIDSLGLIDYNTYRVTTVNRDIKLPILYVPINRTGMDYHRLNERVSLLARINLYRSGNSIIYDALVLSYSYETNWLDDMIDTESRTQSLKTAHYTISCNKGKIFWDGTDGSIDTNDELSTVLKSNLTEEGKLIVMGEAQFYETGIEWDAEVSLKYKGFEGKIGINPPATYSRNKGTFKFELTLECECL